MIKDKIIGKKMGTITNIYLTYILALIFLIPSLVILYPYAVVVKKIPILSLIFLPLIYLVIYLILNFALFKKKIKVKNILISYVLLFVLIRIPILSYVFLPIALMILLLGLKISDKVFLSVKLIKNNIFRLLFDYIINILVFSVVFSGILILKAQYYSVSFANSDEILAYVHKHALILNYFNSIIFSISSYLLYKNFEQNDIIKGGMSE